MDLSWASGLLDWLSAHPGWTTAAIFVIALCEGILVAGLIVPGATLLFVAGALIGAGHIELWPSLIAAFAGAFCGDSISYWLGRTYGERLRTYWPLRRHRTALAKGDEFFAAHGGKSLIFGRFFGPLRGIIPAVAGTMGMPWRPFLVVNFFSALLWAPAYLLPGLVFGASLAVAASVAGRSVALLLLLLVAAWLLWWVGRVQLAPRLRSAAALTAWRARRWGRLHPLAAQILSAPRYALRAFSYSTGWIWWAALVLFSLLLARQAWLGAPSLLDEAVLGVLLEHMQTDWRGYFVLPALLLEAWVWGPALAAGVAWMASGGRWRVTLVLAVSVSGAAVLAWATATLSGTLGATPLYRGAPVLAFPSPEVAALTALVLASGVLATVVYGPLRQPVRMIGLLIPLLAAGSGVIVGRVWLSDAVGGLLLGIVMAGFVVLARSSSQRHVPERSLPAVVAVVLAVAVTVQALLHFTDRREAFVVQAEPPQLTTSQWLEIGPADALGRELRWLDGGRRPVDVQWLAEFDRLTEQLAEAGWYEPERRLHGALRWLQPEPELSRMSPLARWYRGRQPELIRVWPIDQQQRLVLRLWSAPVEITGCERRVWLVTLERERIQPGWPIATVRARPLSAEQHAQVVAGLLGERDVRILEPGQPVRIVSMDLL